MFEKTRIKNNLSLWKKEYLLISTFIITLLFGLTINDMFLRILLLIGIFLSLIQYKKSIYMSVTRGTNPLICFMDLLDSKKLILFNVIRLLILTVPILLSLLSLFYLFLFIGIENEVIYNRTVFIVCMSVCLFGIGYYLYEFYAYRYMDYVIYENKNIKFGKCLRDSDEIMDEMKLSLLKFDCKNIFLHIFSVITYPYTTLKYIEWFKTHSSKKNNK